MRFEARLTDFSAPAGRFALHTVLWIWAQSVTLYTSQFITLILSAVTTSINTSDPVPLTPTWHYDAASTVFNRWCSRSRFCNWKAALLAWDKVIEIVAEEHLSASRNSGVALGHHPFAAFGRVRAESGGPVHFTSQASAVTPSPNSSDLLVTCSLPPIRHVRQMEWWASDHEPFLSSCKPFSSHSGSFDLKNISRTVPTLSDLYCPYWKFPWRTLGISGISKDMFEEENPHIQNWKLWDVL